VSLEHWIKAVWQVNKAPLFR